MKMEAKYRCTWNWDEITETHTIKSLKDKYKDSNLFSSEENKRNLFISHGSGYDNLILEDYLKYSSADVDFIGVSYDCDNMSIIRIS